VDNDEMEVKSRGRPIKQEPVEETEDDSTEEEEEAEVSPKKGAILKKVGLTKNDLQVQQRTQATQKTTAQRKKSRLKIFPKREDVLKAVLLLKSKG
jgi:hypothetical protein